MLFIATIKDWSATWRSQHPKNVLCFWYWTIFAEVYTGTSPQLGQWRVILKFAILAKEGISIDVLREAPPKKM